MTMRSFFPTFAAHTLFALTLVCGRAAAADDVVAPVPAAVPAVVSSLAGDRILQDITRQVSAHLRVEGELQLEWVRPLTLPAGLAADAPVEVTVTEFPSALSSSILVRARLQNAGATFAETTYALRAQLLRDVWVTRTPVERESTFDISQLDARRVDVLREREAMPAGEGNSDFNYTRPIQAGRVISWRDVGRRALVRRGQVIEVAAIDGALTITMKALAMENGAAGESIKVRNLVSKKEFSAQVVADSRAQVHF